ncbi:MAG: dienelactone hydrolase family protein [Phenylobacterium sp.]
MSDDKTSKETSRETSGPAGLSRRDLGVLAAGAAVAASAQARAAPLKVMEMDVEVQTPDGACDAVFVHPMGKAPAGGWPAVLVWTDIMGLRPVFRQMASRMAAEGYAVLVPNPFYRKGRAPIPSGPVNWADPADRAKLMELRSALTPEATARDAIACFAWLDGQSLVDPGKGAGVQGYCMGGPMAFQAAAALPDRIAAVGSFHGGGLVTSAPDSPHKLVARTRAEYLVAIAENDDQKEPQAKDALRAAFKAAGRPAEVEVYAGAQHGWCVPGSAVYNAEAAERAWSALLAMYRRRLT